ncbi:hypothetical protein AB4851_08310 [Burkholderia sp. 22PA0099]|uniref:hypothetical protein n=1 Tax=Burkholderia sp. 22PA0099 TaxID=3237372 RepID=UPI0039C4461D
MLELTEQQWAALCAVDEQNFVSTVRDDIVEANPKLRDDSTLLSRLNHAYTSARAIGIRDDRPLVNFLYMEADAPGFYSIPAVADWLAKPVGTPEQRFDDLLDVVRKTVRDRQEMN